VPPRVSVSDCSLVRQNHGMKLSPLGVSATAGTLRASAGVVLHHPWTEEGVVASPAVNGAQVLHLSVALCVLNDTYREAERLGVEVEGVAVEADGSFDDEWRSTGIEYSVTLDSRAPAEALERLGAVVDEVAEIPRAVRAVRQSGSVFDVVCCERLLHWRLGHSARDVCAHRRREPSPQAAVRRTQRGRHPVVRPGCVHAWLCTSATEEGLARAGPAGPPARLGNRPTPGQRVSAKDRLTRTAPSIASTCPICWSSSQMTSAGSSKAKPPTNDQRDRHR
jgi:hypothetical protein